MINMLETSSQVEELAGSIGPKLMKSMILLCGEKEATAAARQNT